jgi:transposase
VSIAFTFQAHDLSYCRSWPGASGEKTQAFVETLGGKLRLYFLPPYSPDRNPDELVWKHLKPTSPSVFDNG